LLNARILVFIEREGLPLDCIINFLDELKLQILLRVNSLDHLGEVFDCHAALGSAGVVKRCLHHHSSVRKQENALSAHLTLDLVTALGVVRDELLSEALHHTVNDLTLTGQAEAKKHRS